MAASSTERSRQFRDRKRRAVFEFVTLEVDQRLAHALIADDKLAAEQRGDTIGVKRDDVAAAVRQVLRDYSGDAQLDRHVDDGAGR